MSLLTNQSATFLLITSALSCAGPRREARDGASHGGPHICCRYAGAATPHLSTAAVEGVALIIPIARSCQGQNGHHNIASGMLVAAGLVSCCRFTMGTRPLDCTVGIELEAYGTLLKSTAQMMRSALQLASMTVDLTLAVQTSHGQGLCLHLQL